MDRKSWTVTELAAEAGVSDAWIRQLLLSGALEGYKHGPLWAILDEEAQRYLDHLKTRKGSRRGPRPGVKRNVPGE